MAASLTTDDLEVKYQKVQLAQPLQEDILVLAKTLGNFKSNNMLGDMESKEFTLHAEYYTLIVEHHQEILA